ncbi:MAG: MBL fold metallo-hydrolase, partial [Lachnospiraceae bacterium]|nr:MBL fold metallo-hydrolase [Lachnospiraceae bacterium]
IVIGGISVDSMTSHALTAKAGNAKTENTKTAKMEVHYIDVGQGDSTLIMCDGHAMLIDAGDYSKGTAIQNYLQKQKIKKLDYLILTHPDSDHIGGAPVIITKFDIDKVFVSNYEKDNKTYQKMIQALDNKRLKYTTPKVGTKYSLGTADITILAPNKEYKNPNDASIALKIQNGKNKFLFTGDAGEDAEQDILGNDIDLSADVYKAGHHGSRTSTSQEFFEAVNPSYAVISCGEDNSYGHPHAETLNTFRMNGVEVYRTDEDGTIIATSDGEKITFNVPASETWKSGEPNGNSSVWEAPSQNAKKQETPAVKESEQKADSADSNEVTYVLNTKTKKFHKPSCSSLPTT